MIKISDSNNVNHKSFGAFPLRPNDAPAKAISPKITGQTLPPCVDYSPYLLTPIKDQLSRGICVGAAVARLEENNIGITFFSKPQNQNTPPSQLSMLWVYNQAKQIDGYPGEGTWVADAVKAVQQNSIALEEDYPYEENKVGILPIPSTIRITDEYHFSPNTVVEYGVDGWKNILAFHGPMVGVIAVTRSFAYPFPDGIVVELPDAEVLGYHAVLITGYDDNTHRFTGPNSWGPDYGDRGWFHMDYDYVTTRGFDGTAAEDDLLKKILGDLDASSRITREDAIIAISLIMGSNVTTEAVKKLADVTQDTQLDLRDVISILQKAVNPI